MSDENILDAQPRKKVLTVADWPTGGQCNWPLGSVGHPDFHFCRKPVNQDPRNGYCDTHYLKAYPRVRLRGDENSEAA